MLGPDALPRPCTGVTYVLLGLVSTGAIAVFLLGGNEAAFFTLQSLSGHLPSSFWAALSAAGSTAGLLALLAPLPHRQPGWSLAILQAILPALLLTYGLKYSLDLPRPAFVLAFDTLTLIGPSPTSPAFPSGHSIAAFSVAGVLVTGLWQSSRRGMALGVLLLASLIALSRIAVGAHWPLDVLAGIAGGWACGLLGLKLAHTNASHTIQPQLLLFSALTAMAALLLPKVFPASLQTLSLVLAGWGLLGAGLSLLRPAAHMEKQHVG